MKFTSSLKLKLIYVFRINDAAHRGCLKVGEATCDNDKVFGLAPNNKALNESAKKRINQYTQTAGIAYDLLYTELTIYNSRKGLCSFNDKEVHCVLERSGIRKKLFDTENKANEWFITDLETVKRAITAVKEGRESLSSAEVSHDQTPIVFRPEQREAIEKTKKQFKKSNQMLWNAKMRFGKTLSALQVVKDMDSSRTLILTHRPVVNSGWFEDFGKIFYDSPGFAYGSKNNGDSHISLEARAKQGKCQYVYFASMQDLRGSELVGGNFDKNNEVFATAWDCIIVDEAHEGTQTELGKAVMQELTKANTKILRLSGTPFNLLDDFKEDEIYTWDYVMEQRAKASWDLTHFGDPNPYASLPTMNIYTYDLGRLLHEFVDEDVAFNFREFFRVNDNGTFIHVNAKDCFPTASIGGGVNYILWDVNYKGNCSITTIQGTQRDMEQRPLDQFSVFIRYNSAIHIVHKCQSDNSFASIVNSRNPFGLSSNIRGEKTGEIRLITSAGISWLPKSAIDSTNHLLSKYKILMSKVTAEHAGEPDKKGQFKIISRTEIIGPNDVCTDSYLIVGASESKLVVENEYKYIQTRFLRFLLMLSVSSINLSSEKFQFIPLQDFTSNSDINWSRSISEIDTQLYAKYGLSEDEISFIESMIKPM